MALNRKDAAATALTTLAVLVYAASRQGWNVWLVGGSHRWAAGGIMLLGIATCSLGQAGEEMAKRPSPTTTTLAVVGVLSLAFGVWAVATGSLTALSLLTAAFAVLWAGSTARHAWGPTRGPLTA